MRTDDQYRIRLEVGKALDVPDTLAPQLRNHLRVMDERTQRADGRKALLACKTAPEMMSVITRRLG